MTLRFEWDEEKATANMAKHGVDFVEAQSVFADPQSLTIFDVSHSGQEERFIDIGFSAFGRLLVIVYTEREDRIRIISSRLATPNEQSTYEQANS
jgi:uncharacterized DUF497 family protein